MIVPVSDPPTCLPSLLIAGKILPLRASKSIWRPVKGDEMAQNGGLRPSPYSVFLHESCRYPSYRKRQAATKAAKKTLPDARRVRLSRSLRGRAGIVDRPRLRCRGTEIERVMMTTETEFKISEEPLAERVLRQVRSGELDESRLLPSAEKRARDVGKKLDRLAARQGWYTFMVRPGVRGGDRGKRPRSGTPKSLAVEQVTRWRSEVSRFAPDRLEEFDELIAEALNNPAPVQKTEQ